MLNFWIEIISYEPNEKNSAVRRLVVVTYQFYVFNLKSDVWYVKISSKMIWGTYSISFLQWYHCTSVNNINTNA